MPLPRKLLQTIPEMQERLLLIGLARTSTQRIAVDESLDELARLAKTAGGEVVGRRIQVRSHPDPASFIGSGLVSELKEQLSADNVTGVIFDDPLTPVQQRTLEKGLGCKVIDRSILILDIFARGARTAESRLQVELAQLEYTYPRLIGAWVHFSKQYGGIGSKGPGETQLEIDRRQIRKRIDLLKEKLARVSLQRDTQRKRRQNLFKVSLVGYTNAGKSTLFNQLTRSSVTTEDKLFTTLDATTRVMSSEFPCPVVFSDTVGFINKLPHQLIESFKSTLEEVHLADLLLHVVDASDPNIDAQIEQTRNVLREIGADRIPAILVYNKLDQCPDFVLPASNGSRVFGISALKQLGMTKLKGEIIFQADQQPAAR